MSKSFNLENTVGKGTHGFMAPETYEEVYSVKADIFSLGATIYAVANLKRPYKGTVNQIMFKLNIKKAAPEEFAEHCPDSLCPLLLQCLTLDDAHRPNIDQVIAGLDKVKEDKDYIISQLLTEVFDEVVDEVTDAVFGPVIDEAIDEVM